MNIKYDIEKLKNIVNDLCALTGLCMSIADKKGNNLYYNLTNSGGLCELIQSCPKGKAGCSCSDAKMLVKCSAERRPITHICHAGFRDTVVPIFKGERLAAFNIIGRLRANYDATEEAKRLCRFISDEEKIKELILKQPYLSESQLNALINLISGIVFDSAIDIEYDDVADAVSNYIEDRLSECLTVEKICRDLFISKNLLYKSIKDMYSMSVNEYITRRRIRRAKQYLSDSDAPVRSIAESVGYDNYTYFSKLFKRHTGLSPNEYRKTANL